LTATPLPLTRTSPSVPLQEHAHVCEKEFVARVSNQVWGPTRHDGIRTMLGPGLTTPAADRRTTDDDCRHPKPQGGDPPFSALMRSQGLGEDARRGRTAGAALHDQQLNLCPGRRRGGLDRQRDHPRRFPCGWHYQSVTLILGRNGHDVHAPPLTRAGERSHLLSPAIDLDFRINDVIQVLKHEYLRDVVLVGYDYDCVVITGVADRRVRAGTSVASSLRADVGGRGAL